MLRAIAFMTVAALGCAVAADEVEAPASDPELLVDSMTGSFSSAAVDEASPRDEPSESTVDQDEPARRAEAGR
jgi:hypothetical protein